MPLSILVVEDEPSHAEAICRAFSALDERSSLHVTQTLAGYREALSRSLPDIALVDVHLPDGNAVDELRAGDQNAPFPVLIMTSYGDEKAAVDALKAGALDYIVKSRETLSDMPRAVARAIREWQLRLARERSDARARHLNRVLRGVRAVNRLITKAPCELELLNGACKCLIESLGYLAVCVVSADADGKSRVLASATLEDEHLVRLSNTIGRHVLDGPDAWRDGDRAIGAWLTHNDTRYGILAVERRHEIPLDDEEHELFSELARDLAFSLYRIALEREHRSHEAVLRRSEATIRAIYDYLPAPTLVLRPGAVGFVLASCNKAALAWLPRIADLVGWPLSESRLQIAGFNQDVSLCFNNQTLVHREVSYAGPEASSPLTLAVTYGNIPPDMVLVQLVDVTNARKSEEQLRAIQRMEAIGQLAGGIAHDFNNLLSVILTNVGFAIKAAQAGSEQQSDLLEVRKASERAAELTRQLLAFGRKQVLQPRVLELNLVVRGMERMLRRVLGELVELNIELADDLWPVMADPGQLEQVILNLAVNARDAMPDGGSLTLATRNLRAPELATALGASRDDQLVVQLSVTDTGCGMDEATMTRIFEPFFTTKEVGKGTGLGLATVYGIVKQSRGEVLVQSRPGAGTTFRILLPVVDALVENVNRASLLPTATGVETILVAEDEPSLRQAIERVLVNSGYSVLLAQDGVEALELSARFEGTIHLLLTDVAMPRMHGRELAERLTSVRPSVQVLFMSGYADKVSNIAGLLNRKVQFIAKPFDAPALAARVRSILDEE